VLANYTNHNYPIFDYQPCSGYLKEVKVQTQTKSEYECIGTWETISRHLPPLATLEQTRNTRANHDQSLNKGGGFERKATNI